MTGADEAMDTLSLPHFVLEIFMADKMAQWVKGQSSITRTHITAGGSDTVCKPCGKVGGGNRTVWKPVDRLA